MNDDPAERARRAADPATPPAELAGIAHRHPELRAAVATNPACYDDLRAWIDLQASDAPTETITQTLVHDEAPRIGVVQGAESPARGPRSPWPIVAIIASSVLVITVVVLVVILVSRPSDPVAPDADPDGPATSDSGLPVEAAPRPTTDSLPQLPIQPVAVQFDGLQTIDGVQVFADAIVSTSTDQLIRNCWTYAPDTIRDRYGTDQARGANLEAFTHAGLIGQTGAQWQGDLVTVVFANEELFSRYPCPVVRINGEPETYDRIDAEHLVTRMAGRINGTPIDSDDVETQYYIECSADPLFPWTLDGAAQPPIELNRAPVDAAVLALAGQRLAVEQVPTDVDPATRYWKLTAVGTTGPSLIVQTWGIRACVGAAG